MEKTENQRFSDSLKFLKNSRIILNDKDFIGQVDWERNRLSYLKANKGGGLTSDEIETLERIFPQINWGTWVKLGKGEMQAPYQNKKEELNETKEIDLIMSGLSSRDKEEQIKLLTLEVNTLRRKITEIIDIQNTSVIDELKSMIGISKKN